MNNVYITLDFYYNFKTHLSYCKLTIVICTLLLNTTYIKWKKKCLQLIILSVKLALEKIVKRDNEKGYMFGGLKTYKQSKKLEIVG